MTSPLAPIPSAFFSCAGKMLKTDKSSLAKILKSEVERVEPAHIDVEIVDGFHFLHLIESSMPKPLII